MSYWVLLENRAIEEVPGAIDRKHAREIYWANHPGGPAIVACANSRKIIEDAKEKCLIAVRANLADEPRHGWG